MTTAGQSERILKMSEFFQQVYDIAAAIPYGTVVSYGQIARLLGSPRSARMVGWAMAKCPEGLPWHRVIKNDGTISSGVMADLCRELLEAEGVCFLPDGRVDMEEFRWEGW